MLLHRFLAPQNEGGSDVRVILSLLDDASWFGPISFPDTVILTAVVSRTKDRCGVAVMSAAALGTSKAAHSDVAPKKKKGPGALATAYLVIYNVVMTAGYVACYKC